ncbi:hypothetical protein ACFYYB_32640 [Streptomyces sp. NPDC002886]|uniref:hypothetical protein n=1 Tax=Streptomyces sp. NPDC002886 TaxID=3364667 RepID=UPI00367BADAF
MKTGARDVIHTSIDEKEYPVRLAVKSLVRGSEKDLQGVRVEGDLEGKVPHYLTYEVTNTGKEAIPHAYEVFRNLALTGTDWAPGTQVSMSASELCQDTSPDTLAPGASYTSCGMYMVAKDVGAMSVVHTAGGGFITPAKQVASWPVGGGLATASKDMANAGDTIAVRWDAGKQNGGVLELPATLKSVKKGSPADLAKLGLKLDDEQRLRTPYYVTISYRNPGKSDLYSPLLPSSIRLLTEGGQQIGGVPAQLLDGPGITACPSQQDQTMVAPGRSVTQCSIHLTADGDAPVAVGFEDADEGDLSGWRATTS